MGPPASGGGAVTAGEVLDDAEEAEDRDEDRIGRGDQCPDAAEVYNGFEDDDGCPDRGPPEQCVHVDYVQIIERIHFQPNGAELDAAEEPLLQALADALTSNPGIGVGVAAAADPEREASAELGQARVAAVRQALIDRGVDGDRMEPVVIEARGLDDQVWLPILSIDGEAVGQDLPESRLLPHSVDCEADWERWRDRGEPLECDCLDEPPDWLAEELSRAGAPSGARDGE
ncbi:MAG: hypothetical protein DRJ42_21715 [Deltaproteobacteria bacterium]|nr:MAG: hypothetical protein DRJ42_21715 [Deltaproteobacteria bacterium]